MTKRETLEGILDEIRALKPLSPTMALLRRIDVVLDDLERAETEYREAFRVFVRSDTSSFSAALAAVDSEERLRLAVLALAALGGHLREAYLSWGTE